ncbi:MAG: hypothetical protein GDA52_11365 [Rhodobacteraceae bacterium]|nr:hypothetical protein [Paracoccaceae bacterium]
MGWWQHHAGGRGPHGPDRSRFCVLRTNTITHQSRPPGHTSGGPFSAETGRDGNDTLCGSKGSDTLHDGAGCTIPPLVTARPT